MRFSGLNTFLPLFLLLSCARFPAPPTKDRVESLQREKRSPENRAEILALAANKTLSRENTKACAGWRTLSDKNFPLEKLVALERLDCAQNLANDEFNQRLNELIDGSPEWLHFELYKRFSGKKSVNAANRAHLTLLGLPQMESQEEKVEALLEQKEKLTELDEDHSLKEKIQAKLVDIAPRFNEEVTRENMMKVARDFERARKFSRARKLYRQIIEGNWASFEEKVKAWDRLALSFKLERDKETFTSETQKLAQFVENSFEKRPENQQILKEWYGRQVESLRALWTQNETERALTKGQKLFEKRKDILRPFQKAELSWLMGLMAKELEKTEFSLKHLKRATRFIEKSDSNEKYKYHWTFAWELFKRGQTSRAIQFFEELSLDELEDYEKAKTFFWLALFHRELELGEREEHYFHKAGEIAPYNFYGLLARSFSNAPSLSFREKLKRPDSLPRVEWLLFLEKKSLVRHYLNGKWEEYDFSEKKEALAYYHQGEHYNEALMKYLSLEEKLSREEKEELFPALYPLAWPQKIEGVAKESGVSSGLLLSVIRQESAFDVEARSWADAFGLMQLTPERAKQLSGEERIPYAKYTDLYDIETNLKLGASLLKRLKREFDFKLPLYVASYNASSSAIRYWMKTRYRGDFLKFIEDIPYEETRNYIKAVFRNFLIYRGMQTKSLPSETYIREVFQGTRQKL